MLDRRRWNCVTSSRAGAGLVPSRRESEIGSIATSLIADDAPTGSHSLVILV